MSAKNQPSSPPPPMKSPTMPSTPSPLTPQKIPSSLPPQQNKFDQYGCASNSGFFWSPSDASCCKSNDCSDPHPFVCNPHQIPVQNSMDWHGCKKPSQIYDSQSGTCCNALCMAPQQNF